MADKRSQKVSFYIWTMPLDGGLTLVFGFLQASTSDSEN